MCSQTLCRCWPEWTLPDFVTLPMDAHLIRRRQTQIPNAEIQNFLDAPPRIEHQSEERVIADSSGRFTVDTLEKGIEFRTVEVLDRRLSCSSLKRHVEDPLPLHHPMWTAARRGTAQTCATQPSACCAW